jgi:hypothetical protein
MCGAPPQGMHPAFPGGSPRGTRLCRGNPAPRAAGGHPFGTPRPCGADGELRVSRRNPAPTFLCLAKEKSPPERWKRKRRCRPNGPWPFGGKNGSVPRQCDWGLRFAGPSRSPTGCAGRGWNRDGLPPQAGGMGAAFVGACRMELLLFPLPLLWWLSGEKGGYRIRPYVLRPAPCQRRAKQGASKQPLVGADSISARCLPNVPGQRKRKEKDSASLNSPGRASSQGPNREAS